MIVLSVILYFVQHPKIDAILGTQKSTVNLWLHIKSTYCSLTFIQSIGATDSFALVIEGFTQTEHHLHTLRHDPSSHHTHIGTNCEIHNLKCMDSPPYWKCTPSTTTTLYNAPKSHTLVTLFSQIIINTSGCINSPNSNAVHPIQLGNDAN